MKQIIDQAKGKPAEKPAAERPKSTKANKLEIGKPDSKTGGVPIDLKSKKS